MFGVPASRWRPTSPLHRLTPNVLRPTQGIAACDTKRKKNLRLISPLLKQGALRLCLVSLDLSNPSPCLINVSILCPINVRYCQALCAIIRCLIWRISLLWKGKRGWRGTELNRRRRDFQSLALPTELPRHLFGDNLFDRS